jgi:hypothetical protein
MMKNIICVIFIGIVLGFVSCDSQSDIYEKYIVPNGLIYPGPALQPVAYPGNQRIKLSWLRGTDPRVETAKIFWNNYTDSVELVVAPGVDTVSYTIAPIAENTYSFMIHTYDGDGNKSIPVEVLGTVYGENYRTLLGNRMLKSTYYDGLDLLLKWGAAESSETGLEVSWTSSADGSEQTLTVDPSETETVLANFDVENLLKYSSTHLPDSVAIDMIQAIPVERIVDPVTELSKATWTAFPLTGDIGINGSYPLDRLWDRNFGNFMHSADPIALPGSFTWSLGLTAKLSRMKLYPRGDRNDDNWSRGQPRTFEIYGAAAQPVPTEDWADWTLLGSFECIQPSGNGTKDPFEGPTASDIAFGRSGIDFQFVPAAPGDPLPAIQYVRFRSLSHFEPNSAPRILLAEITFWGTLVR